MELFTHLPIQLRPQALQTVKGQRALKFPAGFSLKHNKHWTIVCAPDAAGMVVKTVPQAYEFDKFVAWLSKHGIEHEIIQL